jgi:hypothetical protein
MHAGSWTKPTLRRQSTHHIDGEVICTWGPPGSNASPARPARPGDGGAAPGMPDGGIAPVGGEPYGTKGRGGEPATSQLPLSPNCSDSGIAIAPSPLSCPSLRLPGAPRVPAYSPF